MPRRRLPISLRVAPSLLLIGLVSAHGAAPAQLSEILARFDQEQERIRTLSAEFTETTRSTLLKDTIVAKGRFYMTKPDSVRWEYTSPEEMRFVIAEQRYTGYFPQQKRAESRDIHRWSEQLFRFLGLGQTSAELGRFYEISLEQQPEAATKSYVLALDPRKKRVRKRMEGVLLWIDGTTYLPVKVRYSSSNGTIREIQFDNLQRNPELSAGLYTLEIPKEIPVTTGFSALSGFRTSTVD